MKYLFFIVFIMVSFCATAATSKGKIKKGSVIKANQLASYQTIEKILFSIGEEIITLSERNQVERELKSGLVFSLFCFVESIPKKNSSIKQKSAFGFFNCPKDD